MKTDELYEAFNSPIEPLKPEVYVEPKDQPSNIERNELGFTPELTRSLKGVMLYKNIEDLCIIYPDMKDSLMILWNSIGKPDVKSVNDLSFSEFWDQNSIGPIREQDIKVFQKCISLWNAMSYSQRVHALGEFKSKYNRGIYVYTILMDIIDPIWEIRKREKELLEQGESGSYDSNDGDPSQ